MARGFAVPVILGALALMLVVGFAAMLLLQACALSLPGLRHLSSCTTTAEKATERNLELAMVGQADLQRRIFELERELSARQCARALPDPTAPLTDEGWRNRDLSMLYGCWNLDTTYRTRDIDTGEIRTYNKWQMCFNADGKGKQVMRSTDGVTCEGPVEAKFAGEGLSLIEPGNLPCEGGGYIHQRQITCVAAPIGRASCDTLQPETKGAATVEFERAPS